MAATLTAEITSTDAAEIIDFIKAEMMIAGTPFIATTLADVRQGRSIRRQEVVQHGEAIIRSIERAAEAGVPVRSYITETGTEVIEIHNGNGSHYGHWAIVA